MVLHGGKQCVGIRPGGQGGSPDRDVSRGTKFEQHSYRAAKQLLPGRPPKLIHTLTPLHATSLTAMRRHGVLGPLGLGSQAPPLPHCILPYWR